MRKLKEGVEYSTPGLRKSASSKKLNDTSVIDISDRIVNYQKRKQMNLKKLETSSLIVRHSLTYIGARHYF